MRPSHGLHLITRKLDGIADILCCFCNGHGKEVSRAANKYKDEQEARKRLDELMKLYPDGDRPAVIVNNVTHAVIADDIADVMQCVPA